MPHAQNRAVVNLFRGPNLIEDVATTMRRLEEGDLKLRVRALDSERALTRVLVRNLHMHLARTGVPRGAFRSVLMRHSICSSAQHDPEVPK